MRIIKRNVIRCKKCGEVIESKTVHDFKMCGCGSCFIDGGHDYVRIGGNIEEIEILTEYEDVPGYYVSYLSKAFPCNEPYSSNTLMTMEQIKKLFPEENYYLLITDENDNVIYDSLTELKEGKDYV